MKTPVAAAAAAAAATPPHPPTSRRSLARVDDSLRSFRSNGCLAARSGCDIVG